MPKGAQLIDGPVQARKAAREQLDHGADWLKVYMTHRSWVDKQGNLVSQPTLTLEELGQIRNASAGYKTWYFSAHDICALSQLCQCIVAKIIGYGFVYPRT